MSHILPPQARAIEQLKYDNSALVAQLKAAEARLQRRAGYGPGPGRGRSAYGSVGDGASVAASAMTGASGASRGARKPLPRPSPSPTASAATHGAAGSPSPPRRRGRCAFGPPGNASCACRASHIQACQPLCVTIMRRGSFASSLGDIDVDPAVDLHTDEEDLDVSGSPSAHAARAATRASRSGSTGGGGRGKGAPALRVTVPSAGQPVLAALPSPAEAPLTALLAKVRPIFAPI